MAQLLAAANKARLKLHHDEFPFFFAIAVAGEHRRNEDGDPQDA